MKKIREFIRDFSQETLYERNNIGSNITSSKSERTTKDDGRIDKNSKREQKRNELQQRNEKINSNNDVENSEKGFSFLFKERNFFTKRSPLLSRGGGWKLLNRGLNECDEFFQDVDRPTEDGSVFFNRGGLDGFDTIVDETNVGLDEITCDFKETVCMFQNGLQCLVDLQFGSCARDISQHAVHKDKLGSEGNDLGVVLEDKLAKPVDCQQIVLQEKEHSFADELNKDIQNIQNRNKVARKPVFQQEILNPKLGVCDIEPNRVAYLLDEIGPDFECESFQLCEVDRVRLGFHDAITPFFYFHSYL